MSGRTIIIVLLLALSACGNDPNRTDPLRLAGFFSRAGPSAQTDPGRMARAALEALSEPLMLAVVENDGRTALLVPFGQNGPVRTWTTIDRQTISLHGPRIVATRGLGRDLMSLSASSHPAEGHSITHVTLNAANEPVRVDAECRTVERGRDALTLTSGERTDVTRVSEVCRTQTASFTNTYWIARDGTPRRMRQWIGPEAGFLTIEVLRP